MLEYTNDTPLAIGVKMIRGRSLAHVKWTAPLRALAAADLVTGRAELIDITVLQAGGLCRVSQPYVSAAIRVVDDPAVRREIEAGSRPLIEPSDRVAALLPKPDSLVAAWTNSTPAERIAFANAIGPDNLWDQALVPVIA